MAIRKFMASVLLSWAAVSSASAVGSQGGPSLGSSALQCAGVYMLLMDDGKDDGHRNNVLGAQAVFMTSLYYLENLSSGNRVTQASYDRVMGMVLTSILSEANTDPDAVAGRIIDCEGWREEVLTVLLFRGEELSDAASPSEAAKAIESLPLPTPPYPAKGASRMEINLLVDQMVSRH